jgi:hypothetical protein
MLKGTLKPSNHDSFWGTLIMDSQDYVRMMKPLELDNVTWLCKNNIQHGWNNHAIEIF